MDLAVPAAQAALVDVRGNRDLLVLVALQHLAVRVADLAQVPAVQGALVVLGDSPRPRISHPSKWDCSALGLIREPSNPVHQLFLGCGP